MRRMTLFLMALAMVLSITQCKKEQIEPQNAGNTVSITLEVNDVNKGSRAEVDPPHVNFIEHDTILVASNGKYVGYLVHNGTTFSGDITDPTEGKPLYFYFLGNKIIVSTLTPGTTGECTLNISDQTDYPHLPVISMGVSINRSTGETVNYSSEVSSYEARLHNHCSLMKFNVTTASEAAICITGMNNKVTVDFSKIAETGTGLGESDTDNGFSYDKDEEGIIKMAGRNSEERWVIVLPQAALEGTGEAFSEDNAYFGTRPALSAITTDQYLSSGVSMTVNTPAWNGDLSNLTASSSERYATANNGVTITGTLAANVKVSIADGATVTLDGANINNNSSKNGTLICAGITCKGNATINLYGGSINNINSSSDGYPGIQAGPSGNTLTIQGTGSLSAQGGSNAAGIGGGNEITCGNISLLGGQISACGGDNAPGIGSGQSGSCGDIHISRDVEKINITGGSGASTSIGTNGGGTLTVDDVDDVSYINTDSFVYHPVNLSTLTSNYIAKCGDVLRGTLNNNVTISIDDEVPATVILSGANIECEGIVCVSSDVKFFLFGTNSVIANSNPGIQAPASDTLTIDGSGSINVRSKAVGCAGIGGKINVNCGTINIKGGSITACGGQYGAGIGSGQNASCGNIEIEGGIISATGGAGAAGIGSGSGWDAVCSNIHLYGGSINACGGDGAAGVGSGQGGTCGNIEIEGGEIKAYGYDGGAGIGSGQSGSCGNIQIQGGEVTAAGSGGGNDIGAGYWGDCGTVTLPPPEGALSGLFSVSSSKKVRFSRGNLLSNGTFAANQYTYGDYFAPNYIYSVPTIEWDVLSPAEWDYLYRRSNKVGFATVNGIHGIIILPDIYTGSPITNPFRPNWISSYETCPWDDNIYSGDAWTAMENNGVVFLPAAGSYYNGSIQSQGEKGYYFSSSAYLFGFYCNAGQSGSGWTRYVSHDYSSGASSRYSIRLVRTEGTD